MFRVSDAHSLVPTSEPRLCRAWRRFRSPLVILDTFCRVPLFGICILRVALSPAVSDFAAPESLWQSADQARGDSGIRRYGPRVNGTVHCSRQAAESGEVARARNVSEAADHVPGHFSRRMVDVHDW